MVRAEFGEPQARPRDKVLDRPRDEDLARPGKSGNPRPDVDRQPTDAVAAQLHLARVKPGSDLEAQRTDARNDGQGRSDRPAGAIECREEAIAGGIDLAP